MVKKKKKIVHIVDKYLSYRQDFRSKNVLSSSLNMRKLVEQEENANFFLKRTRINTFH